MVATLVYGVTGFTGALVSRELARRGVPHAVAGRRREAVLAHAREVGAEVRVRGPEAYVFTARAAAEIVARVADDGAIPGFQTPSRAFGPELLRSIEGVEITS